MKVQYNKQTKMTWCYIPTDVARELGIKKGEDVEFVKLEPIKGTNKLTYTFQKKAVPNT